MNKSAKQAALAPPAGQGVPLPHAWRGVRAAELIVGLALAVVAAGTIWGEPRPIGDLYAGLAVGQDVVDGKIGKPDDWAFTTTKDGSAQIKSLLGLPPDPNFPAQGKVCVNQNWGTHFLTYLVYQAAGPTGLLALKFAMIAAAALFICLAARQRQVSWPVALLVAAGAIASGRSYIDMRANLTTLTLAPLALWLLFKTRKNVHWMWAIMVLNGLWANMHGGFIFGLGMTGLWATVLFIQRTIELFSAQRSIPAALKTALRKFWPLPVATIGSVALATFANPYGPINLTYPFAITDPAWQRLNEWQPLLSSTRFGTTWEFFIVMGILGGLLVLRVAGIPGVPTSYLRKPTLQQAGQAVFDLVLAAVVIEMTFKARRFVPLSVIMLAPFLAMQLQWLLDLLARAHRLLRAAVFGAAVVALGVPLTVHAHTLTRVYRRDNPRRMDQTVFDRMHGAAVQPTGAAEFLRDNHITGRVFNEWRWEGYLHWRCPGIKVFIGGRAHQVYDGDTDMVAARLLADSRKYPINPTEELAKLDVHLVVVPIDPPGDSKHGPLMWHLVERPGATWAYVYVDTKDVVIADTAYPPIAELVRRAIRGDLTYPDEASATLSRGMAMTAQQVIIPAADTLQAFLAAAQVKPSPAAYKAIQQLSRIMPDPAAWQKGYFQQQYNRLMQMDYHRAEGINLLAMRAQLASYLEQVYYTERNAAEQARWSQAGRQAADTITALLPKWP